jgi:hypothetical protein
MAEADGRAIGWAEVLPPEWGAEPSAVGFGVRL